MHLKITKERQTKHGDFRVSYHGKPQITVNHNLNPYAFLITLVHELAHFVNYKKIKRKGEPHGVEWKTEFKYLMLPLLNNAVFPDDLLSVLAKHMKNPKASSNSDPKLVMALRKYDTPSDKVFLYHLETGSKFELNNMQFELGTKRRTRYECVEVLSKRKYLVNQNAEVRKI